MTATPGPFPSGAVSVALRREDGRVFVGGAGGDLYAMDAFTLAPVQIVSDLVGQLVDLVVTPDGTRVLALDGTRGLVDVIDAATGLVLAGIDVDGDPSSSGAPRSVALGTPSGSRPVCPTPTTRTVPSTTTTTVTSTTTTTLAAAAACDSARACLRGVPWTTVCGTPIPPKLARTIGQKLPATLAILEEAADESRSDRAFRLARRARRHVQAIVRAARRVLRGAGDPVMTACRTEIGAAVEPGLRRIAERRY